jgi:hypothetical protein
MRNRRFVLAVLIVPATAFCAPRQAGPAPRVNHIALVALAKDNARAAEVEAELKSTFATHGVTAETLRTMFDRGMAPEQMLEQLKQRQIDHLLCMAPQKTIRIANPNRTARPVTIEACLKAYANGTSPEGDPLEANPYIIEMPRIHGAQYSSRSPIPTNPAAAPFRIVKGAMRLYDVATGQTVWSLAVNTKIPADLNTTLQTKFIAHELGVTIEKSGMVAVKP